MIYLGLFVAADWSAVCNCVKSSASPTHNTAHASLFHISWIDVLVAHFCHTRYFHGPLHTLWVFSLTLSGSILFIIQVLLAQVLLFHGSPFWTQAHFYIGSSLHVLFLQRSCVFVTLYWFLCSVNYIFLR